MITHRRLRPAGRVRTQPRLARLLGYVAATLVCGTVLAAGSAVAGAGVALADPTPAPVPAPGVPDPGARPTPNPAPRTPGSTPSPIGPPPTTTPTPDPSTPTPDPSQGSPPPGWNPAAPDGSDDPGLFDLPGQIRKAINDFFAWVVEGALNPVLSALGEAVLTTPDLTGDERVRTMWTTSLVVANAVFVLFIVVAGIIVTSRETLQTSYGLKEIAPRLAVAGVLTNTSLLLTGKAIEFTNAVTAAIAGQGVDPNAAAAALTQALSEARNGNSFLLTLMVLGVLVMAIVVVFTFVLRIALMAILLGIAPLALICHGLPQTEQLAFTWWRAVAACLGIQVGQAVVLLGALRMFLTPAADTVTAPGFMVGLPTPSRLVSILVVAAMVWLLLKIPGWMRTFVLGPLAGSGGRGLIGQIVHTIVMIKTLGAVAGLTRGGGAAAGRAATASTRRAATARRTTAARSTPRPARTASGRGTGGRAGAPAPAMFSNAPAVHTPLPQPAGTSGPVAFSHPPTPSPAARRPASGGGVPLVQFSNPPTATPPPRRPTAARPAPARFSSAAGPAGPTPPQATPAAAPVFSSAPRPQTAPKRPPSPGSTPVFSAAPKPVPPARRTTSRPRSTPPPAPTPAPPARATPGATPARRPSPPAPPARRTSQPAAPPPNPPPRRRPPRSES